MKKLVIVAGGLAGLLLGSGTAQACGTVTFNVNPVNFTTWDPINAAERTVSVTATFTRGIKYNTTGYARSFRFILLDNTNESSPVIGNSGPPYEVRNAAANVLYKTGTAIAPLSTSAVPTTNLANSASGDTMTVPLVFAVPANTSTDFVGGTNYVENLNYAVQCFTSTNAGGTATTGSGLGNSVSLTIPRLVSLTTASPQTINFGNFTTATQQLNIGLKSTSSVNVSVSTANNAQMLRSGAVSPYPDNSKIAYAMTLNGDSIANGTSLTNRPRAGVAGTAWPLILTLPGGIPSGKVAGSYSDTITLTLSPGN